MAEPNNDKVSVTQTLRIYFRETFIFKGLFFSTIATWTGGMFLQKLIMPLVIAGVIDTIATASDPALLTYDMFLRPLLIFTVVALSAQLLIDVGLVLLSRLETRVMTRLYDKVFDHLIQQSMNFHNNSFSGSLVSQSNRFVAGYIAITDTVVINLTQLVVFVVFSSAILFYYAPALAITLFVWSLMFIAINIILTRRRIRYSKLRAAADSAITGRLADSLSNIAVIKTYASEKQEKLHYHDLAEDRAQKGYVYWIKTIQNDAIYGLLMALLQIIILAVSIRLIQTGDLTIGTFLLAQVYIVQALAYLWGLSHITKNIEQHLSDASEMTAIMMDSPLVKDPVKPLKHKFHRGTVEFKGVTFNYDDTNEAIFKDFNLKIKPGEKVGLVGKSGSGKTSLTYLLLRFSDIQHGQILIDGQDISKLAQSDLRNSISHVPQEPLLFHRTLFENIKYGNLDSNEKQIKAIAKLAHAEEFIETLPQKYQTIVGERGVKLSGGQRQRVAIARAMLKNAPILVLDEATSALDSESEMLIQDALWKLMEGRTAIVIAHRLSTIQKMDRIIVMDNGRIAEEGTHRELIRKNGIYARLWSRQSGGFIDE